MKTLPAMPAEAFASSFSATYAGVIAFIAVATEGSFARAADRLGVGRSAISRSVQKLERQLGTRLFARTTRSTSLTGEGERFYGQCRPGVEGIARALDDMRDLREGPPRGHLRISSPVDFGRKIVAPLLTGFCERFPRITIDFTLDDRPADFTADRMDVSFRNGRLEDSQVIARQLMPMPMVLCASPGYLACHGSPRHVDDIGMHRCVNFRLASGRVREWEFSEEGHVRSVSPNAVLTFNDADLVLQAALDGHGLAQVAGYQVGEHLQAGRLVACLPQNAPEGRGHFICYLSRQQVPTRVRVFIDYILKEIHA